MLANEIRQKFLDFFEKRGHSVIPSSSLIPDDKSVLLTTAGMQQFKKYYTGELDPKKDFNSNRVVSVQKCFRTSDIDLVGDESHLTFFEMLGNFSFGPAGNDDPQNLGNDGYFKRSAIYWAYDFIIKEMGLIIDYVSVFEGDKEIPQDKESEDIWKELGVKNIKRFGRDDNFWGPTGSEGPCGPTTEIYVNGIEIWNLVFNQYYKYPDGRFEKLKNSGIDTGMGLERLVMTVQGKKNIFEIDFFQPLFDVFPDFLSESKKRILIDHARAIVFLIGDGVIPSNKDAGYILRRILRRYIVNVRGFSNDPFALLIKIIDYYNNTNFYRVLDRDKIFSIFKEESSKFEKALVLGNSELNKMQVVDAKIAFKMFESYGLPFEVIKDLGGDKVKNLKREDFDKEFKNHQEISRAGLQKKFGGHGLILDTGELKAANQDELEKVTRLHTTTHLLHQALREVLGNHIRQMGSDITYERLRFDFSHQAKLTNEEIDKIESLVNDKIKDELAVSYDEMSYDQAINAGALAFFRLKYPDTVRVYSINGFSKEVCGGPHVKNTKELGKFKITKEESSSAGVRRIRAILS